MWRRRKLILLSLSLCVRAQWWQEIEAMAGSPRQLTAAEQEQQGSLAVAITHYIGATFSNIKSVVISQGDDNEDVSSLINNDSQSALVSVFPEYSTDTFKLTKALLQAIDKFSINSFSLTEIDLTNIGVAILPSIALINHSCKPNCSVVFPNGPRGEMKVLAFKTIQPGEEVSFNFRLLLR